jgi:hypothetical protein
VIEGRYAPARPVLITGVVGCPETRTYSEARWSSISTDIVSSPACASGLISVGGTLV